MVMGDDLCTATKTGAELKVNARHVRTREITNSQRVKLPEARMTTSWRLHWISAFISHSGLVAWLTGPIREGGGLLQQENSSIISMDFPQPAMDIR